MTAFDDVEQFVKSANRATRMGDLSDLLSNAVQMVGFDHVALVHHVNLSAPGAAEQALQFINYPDAWRALMRARGYLGDDPVLAAVQKSAAAFLWSELPGIIALNPRQMEILDAASACGLGEGFTVPVNVPGEFLGSCSFAMRAGREVRRKNLPAAQYIGCFAFEAARRIRLSNGAKRELRPTLTGRQFDCLVLAAQGKSDWHIAQLLGISHETVHQHIEMAKRRYNVASRTQLVVRALFDSQITFADVIGPGGPSPH
ncbi:MAG: luxR [Phenylobacterium sp.]|nr:luxR [Phenylobacterium sp.]MDB5462210.1 luxR [Phenylobacterium sp.]